MAHRTLKCGTVTTKPACCCHQKRYLAVMDYCQVDMAVFREGDLERVIEAYHAQPKTVTGYVAYTDIRRLTRLSYPRIFAALKSLHKSDPYAIRFSINLKLFPGDTAPKSLGIGTARQEFYFLNRQLEFWQNSDCQARTWRMYAEKAAWWPRLKR